MEQLTIKQAFQVMVSFLENFYERTGADDIGILLGDLQILEDGVTADPAAWEDWLESVDNVLNTPTQQEENSQTAIQLTTK